jgi:N-acetylglucosaminyl-diphospho-decaprenol L-rhamnosyltransferase
MRNDTLSSDPHAAMKPDVSIVIVSWNTRELLRDCLTSVFRECGGLTLEVFVVDNASTDSSPEMVRASLPEVRLIENEANIGFAAANNRAFAFCQADKILLLNSDTVLKAGALKLLVDFLDLHREAAAVAPKLEQSQTVDILGCGRQLSLRTAMNHWLFFARLFPRMRSLEGIYYYREKHDNVVREVDWVSGACMLVRKTVIEQVGPLNEQWFMYAEDQEWCARMKIAGWKIFHLPEAIVEHRHGASFEQNPEISLLPLKASRDLYVRLNEPSRAGLMLYDLIVGIGLTLRGIGYFVRSMGETTDTARARRNRSKMFFVNAVATLRLVGSATH